MWFPFGHGLSYTKYEYSGMNLKKEIAPDGKIAITVSAKIKNIGKCAGKEVVQLYVSHKNSVVLKPEKDLQYYNICLREWHTESDVYNLCLVHHRQTYA